MKIYFIGAGPGDPQLLTIKAKNIIERADIIIYAGSLVNAEILKFAGRNAEIHDSSWMNLGEILKIYARAKKSDREVARLHTGEPALYGAIQEQMDWCVAHDIDFEVIPGISSFQAAAAALRQELTLPGVSQTVILTRISGRTRVPGKEDLSKLSRIKATLVIFLSVREIERVVQKLRSGYSLRTPVCVLERVSLKDERKISGTLEDIAAKVRAAGIKRQALIIVGDVLKKKYKKSRLYDRSFSHMFRRS